MKNDEGNAGPDAGRAIPASSASFNILDSSVARRWAVFVALSVLALAVRLPQLGARPMHTDESVNAYITGELLAGAPYHYDPQDRHGPALYAMAEPLAKLSGAKNLAELTESELRLGPVIVGSVIILLFGAGVEMFGFTACLVAALLFAVSPLPVYYSRYFIHETLFVAATLGLILAGGRALGWSTHSADADTDPVSSLSSPKGGEGRGEEAKSHPTQTSLRTLLPAALAGFCAALMLACKETAPLHYVALAFAAAVGFYLPQRNKIAALKIIAVIAVALAVFVFAFVLLFTWFGQNWSVFADLARAVPNFAARAGGEGHQKPFGYYFHLIDPMVVLTLVAAGGAFAAICDAVGGVRKAPLMLTIYGLAIFLIYSFIPYKTPWLALNIWLPLSLVCGFGVAAFLEQINNAAGRWVVGIAGAFLLALLALQTKVLVFDRPADEKNPLAYAHTGEDILGLAPRLEQLAAEQHLTQPRIAVVAADPWPLPWYLRKFSQVGYWQPGQETGPADFIITTPHVSGSLEERLKDYRPEFFGVRPGVLIMLWTHAPAKSKP